MRTKIATSEEVSAEGKTKNKGNFFPNFSAHNNIQNITPGREPWASESIHKREIAGEGRDELRRK